VQARCPSRGMAPPARRAIADAAPRPEDAEPDLRDCRDGARGRGREREHRNAVQSRRRLPVRPRDRRRVHCHGLLHGQRDVRLGANPPARRPAPKDLRSKSRAPPRVRAGLGRERGWGGAGRTRTAVGTTRTPSTSTRNPPPSRSPYTSPYRTNDALPSLCQVQRRDVRGLRARAAHHGPRIGRVQAPLRLTCEKLRETRSWKRGQGIEARRRGIERPARRCGFGGIVQLVIWAVVLGVLFSGARR